MLQEQIKRVGMQRQDMAAAYRAEGMTLKSIGEKLGVCAQAVRVMLIKRSWRRPADGVLSSRAARCLEHVQGIKYGVMPDPEWHAGKPISLYKRAPRVGPKTISEVSAWLVANGKAPLLDDEAPKVVKPYKLGDVRAAAEDLYEALETLLSDPSATEKARLALHKARGEKVQA